MSTKRHLEYWVIPPKNNAEFVAHMENVLDTYAKPYDASHPVICMDEQPIQLIKEKRQSLPETRDYPKRIDYEYERNGSASIFLFCEPLTGWRQATAREQRTKSDWAQEVAVLLDGRYKHCEQITLVCDNLNTHTIGAFYEAFEPTRARQYARRLTLCFTPKHGSWLNISENELSSLTRQCLNGRYIAELHELQQEISAWAIDVNRMQKGVDWHMKADDARIKLKSIYPNIQF